MTHRSPLEELERAKTNREVGMALDHAPHLQGKRCTGGSHVVYIGPHGSLPAPTGHPGECNRNLKKAIIKQAIAIGLFCLILFFLQGVIL